MAREARTYVSTKDLAAFFDLTPTRVRQLVADGMPQEARDKFDFVSAVRWYIRFLQEANKRRTQPGDVGGADSLRRERAAVLKLDSEIRMMELEEKRGRLVAVDAVAKEFEERMGIIRSKMLGAIPRGGLKLLGARTQAQAIAIMEEAIHEALRAGMSARDVETNGANGNGA